MMFGFIENIGPAASQHVTGFANAAATDGDDAGADWADLVLDGGCPTAMLHTLIFSPETRGDAGSRRRPTLVQ